MSKNIIFLVLLFIASWTNAALRSNPFRLDHQTLKEVKEHVPDIALIYSQFKEITDRSYALHFLYEFFDELCIPTLVNESIFHLKRRLVFIYKGILENRDIQDSLKTFEYNIGHILFYVSLKTGESEFLVQRTVTLDEYNIAVERKICKFISDQYINDATVRLNFGRLLVVAKERSLRLKPSENEIIYLLPHGEFISLSSKYNSFLGFYSRFLDAQSLDILYGIFMEISEWGNSSTSFKQVIISAYKKISIKTKEQVYSFILSQSDFSRLQFHYQVMSSDDNPDFEKFQLKESASKVREFFVTMIENEIKQLKFDESMEGDMINLLKSFDVESKDLLVKLIAYEIEKMGLNESYAIPLVNLLKRFDIHFSA
jgi:hypothetical protein